MRTILAIIRDFAETVAEIAERIERKVFPEKVTVIIPCYNEAKTVGKVVSICRKSPVASEIIVVNDGSTDSSAEAAEKAGARVVSHPRNLGKGRAISTGVRAARNEIIVFFDADLSGLSPRAIYALAKPVIDGKAILAKGSFERSGGRVTELVAKPLLEVFFPGISLPQPLSGQFATRKSFLSKFPFSRGWGVDIEIVLEAARKGERVVAVDIGRLSHKNRDLNSLSSTSGQVMRAILRKAGLFADKHRLIIFDFDRTLVQASSISLIAKSFGFSGKLARARRLFFSGEITERELTAKIATFLSGIPASSLASFCSEGIPKTRFADETLALLRRKGYRVAVVSFAFRQVIDSVFNSFKFDAYVCPELSESSGAFTGNVRIPNYSSGKYPFSKAAAAKALLRKFRLKKRQAVFVGDSHSDAEASGACGKFVLFSEKRPHESLGKFRPIKSLPELVLLVN